MSRLNTLPLWVLIALAFAFSFAVRLIWVYQFDGIESVYHNGVFMINTNDGYYFAEGARDLLRGEAGIFSPTRTALAQLTALFAFVLPFSFETIIFYMPAVLGSLVVVPILLLGNHLNERGAAFIGALVASIGVSYYNRTMSGYYDTDMLNIVFPMLLVWSLALALQTKEAKYLLITGLEMVAYRWWYPQSYSLEFAFFGLVLLYVLVYERKNTYNYQLLAMMLVAMMGLPDVVRLVGVFVLFGLQRVETLKRHSVTLLGVALVLFFATGGLGPVWKQLQGYVFRASTASYEDEIILHFFSVMQTVREAGHIPFETFAVRISGHVATFVVSLLGYLLLVRKHPVMLLGLPLLGLGFLAYVGGLRFTIYAVPIAALGLGYGIVWCKEWFATRFAKERNVVLMGGALVVVATLGALYPNITHVINYRVPTVMNANEVAQLETLGESVGEEAYVVSWWDYGYPLRYYGKMRTLIDGGKHSGAVNFPVSFMLHADQTSAAAMARLEVEYTQMRYDIGQDNRTKPKDDRVLLPRSNLAWMMSEYGYEDANAFLDDLPHVALPPKNHEVYMYLPYRMMPIMQTVAQFSALDVMSGTSKRPPLFFMTSRFQDTKEALHLGGGVKLDKVRGIMHLGDQQVPLKRFIQTRYEAGALAYEAQNLHPDGALTLIFMEPYQTFLLVDEPMFASTFVQLFVLENPDQRFFTPVSLTPWAKIYKLNR
ncbi:peptide transporter [Sulfurospirillum sp. T05]|uniref:Peptide transporter n=1 Tax=Sulfurospirillum tamanense TaxID=2813362 RepID=A0ABS2WSJ1_9BACT|nr:STT3 domain-containing protein [Sulfurospirillum tamanensis]MBN2964638.1 peptide transporter [Sulfurospirillum tamanensis]